MVWGSIQCAVSVPRELEGFAVASREMAIREFVREADRCAVRGTFFRIVSIPSLVEGVRRLPGHRVENREWGKARLFEITITDYQLLSFLGRLSKKYESPTRHCTYGGHFRSAAKTCLRTEAQRGL